MAAAVVALAIAAVGAYETEHGGQCQQRRSGNALTGRPAEPQVAFSPAGGGLGGKRKRWI